jgi:hypothetical protein
MNDTETRYLEITRMVLEHNPCCPFCGQVIDPLIDRYLVPAKDVEGISRTDLVMHPDLYAGRIELAHETCWQRSEARHD